MSKTAAGTSSAQIGTVTVAALGSTGNPCVSASGRGVTAALAPGTVARRLNAFLYTASTGATSGFVSGLNLAVTGVGSQRQASLAGRGDFRYTNSTGTLSLSGVFTVKAAASCPGGLAAGEDEAFRAAYMLSPSRRSPGPPRDRDGRSQPLAGRRGSLLRSRRRPTAASPDGRKSGNAPFLPVPGAREPVLAQRDGPVTLRVAGLIHYSLRDKGERAMYLPCDKFKNFVRNISG